MNHRKHGKLMFFSFFYGYHVLNWSPTAHVNKCLMGKKYNYFNHFLPVANRDFIQINAYLMINTTHDKKQKETLKSKYRHLKKTYFSFTHSNFFQNIKEFHKGKCNLL